MKITTLIAVIIAVLYIGWQLWYYAKNTENNKELP